MDARDLILPIGPFWELMREEYEREREREILAREEFRRQWAERTPHDRHIEEERADLET